MSPAPAKAKELAHRAELLRGAARRAGPMAHALTGLLKSETGQAHSQDVWTCPYATQVAAQLQRESTALKSLADTLVDRARDWSREAARLEEEAKKASHGH